MPKVDNRNRKRYQCIYKVDWEYQFTWLQGVHGDTTKGHCIVCKKEFSITNQGVHQVKQHADTATHKSRAASYLSNDSIEAYSKGSESNSNEDYKVATQEITLVYHHLNMRWSEADTIKFVELYRNHECLWNIASVQYRNKQMRQTAYEALVQEMGMDGFGVNEVKLKIKSLRCTYNQERSKIQRSKELGANWNDVYSPAVKWFGIMDAFVRNVKEKRLTQNNLITYDNVNYTSEPIKIETVDLDSYEEEGTEDIQYNTLELEEEWQSPTSTSHAETRLSTAVEELEPANPVLVQPESVEHECDAFGRYVALSLKKLPLKLSIMAQSELQATLTRYRITACSATVADLWNTSPTHLNSPQVPSPWSENSS